MQREDLLIWVCGRCMDAEVVVVDESGVARCMWGALSSCSVRKDDRVAGGPAMCAAAAADRWRAARYEYRTSPSTYWSCRASPRTVSLITA